MINYLPIPEDGSPKAPGYCAKWGHKWTMWSQFWDGFNECMRRECFRCKAVEYKNEYGN